MPVEKVTKRLLFIKLWLIIRCSTRLQNQKYTYAIYSVVLYVGRQKVHYKKSNVCHVYSGKLEKDWEINALCSVYMLF